MEARREQGQREEKEEGGRQARWAPRPRSVDAMLKPGRGGGREVEVGPQGSRKRQKESAFKSRQGPARIWGSRNQLPTGTSALASSASLRMPGTGRSWQLLEFSWGKCPRSPFSGEVTPPFFVSWVFLFCFVFIEDGELMYRGLASNSLGNQGWP